MAKIDDKQKNRKKLLVELKTLRKNVSKLEEEQRLRFNIERERKKLEHFLQERVKELTCLYGIADLIESSSSSIDKILQGTADLLPPSWQYPEITAGKITFEHKTYISKNFRKSKWKQKADILLEGKKVGKVEVYYLDEMEDMDEGPFLKEERLLIDAIGERLGRACERIRAGQQLKIEQTNLKNVNITLREVLSKMQEEKKEIGARVVANVDRIIMPLVFELERNASSQQIQYLNLLETNLQDITSPFTHKLSKTMMNLTVVEIQICNLIKNGLLTKEISQIRNISPATVSRHRERIRWKLGITNTATNLATYLKSFMSESES